MTAPSMSPTSLWWDQLGAVPSRPALEGDTAVDVAIVGAGYTGLWTAYSLLAADPSLRVLVIERDHVGFGASGRNGGWCVGELAGGLHGAIARAGRAEGIRLTRAVMDTVGEVGRVVAEEAIDCGFVAGGVVRLARTAPQLARQHEDVEYYGAAGFGDDVVALGPDEARERLAATDVLGGVAYRPAARVQPAQLVVGLAAAVERRGGRIVERTTALDVEPAPRSGVRTDLGRVSADVVVLATEGYTRDLPGRRRQLLPFYSLMVATEPLPAEVWDRIGLADRATFADDRRTVIYGQRTTDDRIAFGGRGARYRFGSGIDPATERDSRTHDRIAASLRALLPQVADAAITHRWGGVLGIPRDWRPSVGFDRATGLAWAGGYVGEGVAAANLAGRTLAELIQGRSTDLTDLAWVGHRSRSWEPEPFRWIGVNGSIVLAERADRTEARTGRPSLLGRAVDALM